MNHSFGIVSWEQEHLQVLSVCTIFGIASSEYAILRAMFGQKKHSGWNNSRARPFVGRRVLLTRLHQLYGAKRGQRIARRNKGSLQDFPPILQLQTKTGCNASCVYCPQRKIRGMFPDSTLSEELFRSIVDQCVDEPNLHGIGFVLHNEPLTDPTLFDKISYFRRRVKSKALTFLVTNGTLLTPDVAERLLKSGLDVLHISCNGFGKEAFEAVNREKSWKDFMNNLDSFFEQDLSKTAVMMSFVRSNVYRLELEYAIRYWRSRGIRSFVHGINNRAGLVDDYERYARPMDREKMGVKLRKMAVKNLLGCCPYPFLQMSILATGECLICTHDWGRHKIIGDLNKNSIRDVWNGPVMREIRLKHIGGEEKTIPSCRNCDVFENATFA
jgi:MoaA/NifB/PqqE/SkfB family radical SAM enzyme